MYSKRTTRVLFSVRIFCFYTFNFIEILFLHYILYYTSKIVVTLLSSHSGHELIINIYKFMYKLTDINFITGRNFSVTQDHLWH